MQDRYSNAIDGTIAIRHKGYTVAYIAPLGDTGDHRYAGQTYGSLEAAKAASLIDYPLVG